MLMDKRDITIESKEAFIARYCANSRIIRDRFDARMVAMECTCEDGGGPTHWAAIFNNPLSIQDHLNHEEVLEDLREMGEVSR
jgi:hypothetical protein